MMRLAVAAGLVTMKLQRPRTLTTHTAARKNNDSVAVSWFSAYIGDEM